MLFHGNPQRLSISTEALACARRWGFTVLEGMMFLPRDLPQLERLFQANKNL